MNKEKQHLVELLSKIDHKKEELKQLKKEYKGEQKMTKEQQKQSLLLHLRSNLQRD